MWSLYITVILCLTALASGEEPKIIIIGAGVSGIAAASKLYEHGFKEITILEAENRIGGRVYTTWFDESWVDVGGQTIDGEVDNVSFELASPLGLLEVPPENGSSEFRVYNSKGVPLPKSVGNTFVNYYVGVLDEDNENMNGSNGSVADYLTRIITAEAEKYPTIDETLLKQFMHLFECLEMTLDASDNWNEVSMRGYLESWNYAGGTRINWKDRGYGTILDILMKKYPNPEEELPVYNNTVLNSEVVNIDYNSTGGKVVVKTIDGQNYTVDHVIATPSLGVLKGDHDTLFTPNLPESKVQTIKGLAFGTIAKIYLSFETPWWPNNFTHLAFIWDDDDKQEYENDPDKKWLVDVTGVFTVPHRPRLLCGWTAGASARYMGTLSEDKVLNQMIELIDKFLGKSYNVTRPRGILRTAWHSNKHFRGTYSYRSMETERADVWAERLAAPLLVNEKPVVMFAGEATNPHYYGTVHGAIETGHREAKRLIGIYNKTVT